MNDLKFAFRQLLKNPGFTAVVVLTLALGIGANTAIFSVINAVVLRPLPYHQPDHLVRVWGNFAGIGLPNNQNAISVPEFKDLESQARCFSHVAAIASGEGFNLKLGDYPQRVEGAYTSPSLFPLLGVQPAYNLKTLEEWTQDSLALRRLGTLLLSAFSGVALVLAAVGIYGVMAYWVGQRTHEIGLRVALGAQKTQVLSLVLRKGLLLAGIGGVVGMLGATAANRVLHSLLYGVQPTDLATFVLGPLVMGTAVLLACYLPARRAAKVDPIVTLRCD